MTRPREDKERRCSQVVYRPGSWTTSPCSRRATVVRDGKPFCYQHDPEIVKPAKEARIAAQIAVDRGRVAVTQARQRLLQAVLTTEGTLPLMVERAVEEVRATESNLMGAEAALAGLRGK